MIRIEGEFYIDENNNRWNINHSLERVKSSSEHLTNCYNCTNCFNCTNCTDCTKCSNCNSCNNCKNCFNCYCLTNCNYCETCEHCVECNNCRICGFCNNCTACLSCISCTNCIDNNLCEYCIDCEHCNMCASCNDYKENPNRYTTPKIGSRRENTTIYWLDDNVQIVCGCFRGNIRDWEYAIRETHENNKEHLNDYLRQVEIVKIIVEMNEED